MKYKLLRHIFISGISAFEVPLSIRLHDKDIGQNQLLALETNEPEIFNVSKVSNFEWQVDLKEPILLTSTDPCFGNSVKKDGFEIIVSDQGIPVLSQTSEFELQIIDVNNHAPRKSLKIRENQKKVTGIFNFFIA